MSGWTKRTEVKTLVEFRGVWVDPAAVDAARLADSFANWKIEVHLRGGTTIQIDTGSIGKDGAKPVLREFMVRLASAFGPEGAA